MVKFIDEMSIPQWKMKLLQNKQRKKEEEKRKEREKEEQRLAKLPPWKRQAEQPKTVIIIDKNNVANPVDLSGLQKSPIQNNNSNSSQAKSSSAAPLVNGAAPLAGGSGESSGSKGHDEADSGSGGVSEEHCTPVQNNPFLTLERKKRKAPPPPKQAGGLNVIATNVSVTSPSTEPSTTQKAKSPVATRKSTNAVNGTEPVKSNNIKVNGPSVVGNQTHNSTKSSSDKKTIEDVPISKAKSQRSEEAKGRETSASALISITSPKVQITNQVAKSSSDVKPSETKIKDTQKSESKTNIRSEPVPETRPSSHKTSSSNDTIPSQTKNVKEPEKSAAKSESKRKQSISELRDFFGGSIVSVGKSKGQSKQQTSHTSSKSSKDSLEQSESKSKTRVETHEAKPAQQNSSTKQSNSTTNQKSAVLAEPSAAKTQKKNDVNLAAKSGSKNLLEASKPTSPVRQKPSAEMPASAIISLTNEGPLQRRQGQMVRSTSVIDDDDEMALTLESPRSPSSRRLQKERSLESDDGSSDSQKVSPAKRQAPKVPPPSTVSSVSAKVDEGKSNDVSGVSAKVEEDSKAARSVKKEEKVEVPSAAPSAAKDRQQRGEDISYPKNFRSSDYAPEKKSEEIPYPRDFRKPQEISEKKPSDKTAVKVTSGLSDPPARESKKPGVDQKKESASSIISIPGPQTNSTDIKSNDQKPEKKSSSEDKPKEKAAPSNNQGAIPYPDDFRRPKNQAAASKSKNTKKDIVKPSELMQGSSSSAVPDSKEDSTTESTGNPFGLKLRKTKPPASNNITMISSGNAKAKPDNNASKSPGGLSSSSGMSTLIAVGQGGNLMSPSGGKKKKVDNVKKFEKVEFIGYNSPSGKPSALKASPATGKSPKKHVNFTSHEEEVFEYLSEEASCDLYDDQHQGEEEEDHIVAVKTKNGSAPLSNGIKNGSLAESDDDEEAKDDKLKNNTAIGTAGGFQNLAASNLSAMDMLLGRGRPVAPPEEPKPTPPSPQPDTDPQDMALKPTDGDYFSTAGQGTSALLF